MGRSVEITPELRAALDAIPRIKMRIYSHPDWGGKFYLAPESALDVIRDNHNPETFDESLLTFEEVEMTQTEIDELPEWDG